MAKSAKAKTKVVGTTIDAMIKEGKALGRIWKQTNSLTASTKASGFDTRLGKLLQQLKASSPLDSGQISRQTLTTHGVHVIDRRRRSEALWFVENEVECRDFIAKSKKGFTSLTALQKAMRDAAKADEPSNVGQNDTIVSDSGWKEPKAKKSGATVQRNVNVMVTRTKMVDTILHHCQQHNLNVEDIIADLQSHLATQKKSV
jgi:hypothetical protein